MTAILGSIKTRKFSLLSHPALTFAPVGWLLSVSDMNRSYRLSFIPKWLSPWKNSKTERQEVQSEMDMVQRNGPQTSAWTELYTKDRLHPAIIIILDIMYGFKHFGAVVNTGALKAALGRLRGASWARNCRWACMAPKLHESSLPDMFVSVCVFVTWTISGAEWRPESSTPPRDILFHGQQIQSQARAVTSIEAVSWV